MASVQKGYGIKSKTFAKMMYEMSLLLIVMWAFLAGFNLIMHIMYSANLMYSAFMPYALIPADVFSISAAGEMVCYGISIAVIIFYILCGILGKKHVWFIAVGAILYTIDTAVIAFIWCYWPEVRESVRLDLVLHVVFLLYWFMGAFFGFRMKKLPEDEPLPKEEISYNPVKGDSSILRIADTAAKARILLEKDVDGQHICYRRVKRVNELVIDRYVYDEIEMLMETPHVLSAQRNGHLIEVGCDKSSHSFIRIDGNEVARKMRIV